MATIAVPTVRGFTDAAKDYGVGLGAGIALSVGRSIFGNNFITSLGIAALNGSVIKGPRGQQVATTMGILAMNGPGTAPSAPAAQSTTL